MNIAFDVVIMILVLHFVGDFLLQNTWMLETKRSNLRAMGAHIICIFAVLAPVGFIWAAVNCVSHTIMDFISSRFIERLWAEKRAYWFYLYVGLAQAAHIIMLFLTYKWLFL